MTDERDAMLVAACLRGEVDAFDELVDRYQGPLFNVAYRITGSIDDAMDVTQAAFVKAFEKLDTFNPKYRFFSWIYRIAINQSLNLVDRRREEPHPEVEPPARHPNPEHDYRGIEAAEAVQGGLMALPPHSRAVIVLRHIQGLSYREIGELLEIPEKTVKSRLFTARRQLRQILQERGVTP